MSSSSAPWFAELFTDDRVRTLSHQVSTLHDNVWELEHKNTQLLAQKNKLEKQLEETKAAAQAISSQKEELERSLKSENEKLLSEILSTQEKCRQYEAEVEKLKTKLDAMVEENEAAANTFNDEKAEMILESEDLKRRLDEIQANKYLVECENDKFRSEALIAEQKQNMFEAEIEKLKVELNALVEAKEAAAKAFDAQNAEIANELEVFKAKLEDVQKVKDLVEGENENLRSEVLAAEEKCSQSEADIKCLKQILGAVVEAKEAAAKSFDAEKVEIMKASDNLKRELEEIQTGKDLVERQNDELRSQILTAKKKCSMLEAEVMSLKMDLGALEEAKKESTKAFDVQKAQILKELEDVNRKVEQIQSNKDLLESENYKLQMEILTAEQKQSMFEAEVDGLKKELGELMAAKESAAKAFDSEKAKTMKELQDLKKKVEEIQVKKDLVEGEKDKLRLEILIAEQKHSMSQLEVKRLKMEIEAKETTMKSFDVEKEKIMKEAENLKRKIEEIQVSKEAAEEARRDKDAEANKLRAELVNIHSSMSQLQASCNELDAKLSHLNDEKKLVQKSLENEKVEACKLKSKVEELEICYSEKAGETEKLKATLEEKKSEIEALSKDIELLRLAVTEAQEKNKGSILSCLSSLRSR